MYVVKRMMQSKKDKELTEDDAKRMQEKVQRLTDEFAKKIEKEVSEKEKEIMKV